MFLLGTAPGHHFLIIYVDFVRKLSIFGPLQKPVGAKNTPELDQVAPKGFQIQSRTLTFKNLEPTSAPGGP